VSSFSVTWQLTQRNAVKSVNKVFGEKGVEAILQTLGRLEARATLAQPLEVIHGLVQKMVVIDGMQAHEACNPPYAEYLCI